MSVTTTPVTNGICMFNNNGSHISKDVDNSDSVSASQTPGFPPNYAGCSSSSIVVGNVANTNTVCFYLKYV